LVSLLAAGLLGAAEQAPPPLEIHTGWQYSWAPAPESGAVSSPDWRTIRDPVNPPGREGRTELWLRVRLPEIPCPDPALLIDRRGVLLAFETWLDDRMIYHFGMTDEAGGWTFPGVTSHLIALPPDFAGSTLKLHVFSDYSNIGLRGRMSIGRAEDLIRDVMRRDADGIVIGLLIIFFGIFDLFIALEQPEKGSRAPFFGIYALCVGLYTINLTTVKDLVFHAPMFWFTVYFIALILMPVGIVGFVWQTFRPERGSLAHRLWQAHIGYALVCLVFYLAALWDWIPRPVAYFPIHLLRFVFILEMVYLLGIVANQAFRRGNVEARIYIAGLAPVAVFGAYDLLVALGPILSDRSFVQWGLFCFVFSLGMIRRRRHLDIRNRLVTYAHELERRSEEKEKLMKDLHDGIGGLATSIFFLAETAKSYSSEAKLKRNLAAISELSTESLGEIRTFMHSLDDQDRNWSALIAELRHHGSNLIEAHGLEYELDAAVDQRAPNLSSPLYLNLFRIHKEALTNIIKHARAGRVRVTLEVEARRLTLCIRDDGIGFKQGGRREGGTSNMAARAAEMGGTLEITSEQGACVRLELPLPQK